MHLSPSVWIVTVAVLLVLLALDIFVIGRKPHEPSMKEAGLAIAFFVALAVAFGCFVWAGWGPGYAGEFFAGWLTEYSLSVDNLFIFVLIMNKFAVPRHLQQYALLVGIVIALVMRGIFIALGAAVIERFVWIFFLFGAFLVYTAIHLVYDHLRHSEEEEATDNSVIRFVKTRFPVSGEFDSTHLFVRAQGRRLVTPMFLVIIALGTTDLLFALDSIPAIYGLTQEPYLVFTANVFALMGLRQLYFLIGGLLKRLVYLAYGLAVILGFIGVKLLLHAMHEYGLDRRLGFDGEISILASLAVIVVTLIVTVVASLWKSRRDADAAPV